MGQLLAIAEIVEKLVYVESIDEDDTRCNALRHELNQVHAHFVDEWGLLSNCRSYWNSVWNDLRLEIYLSNLLDDAGNKADIFFKRTKFPARTLNGQQFFEEDINQRLASAFSWCMGWFGRVDINEIAEKAGVTPQFAEENLLEQELIYREWTGYAQDWWELLEVSEDIYSEYQLKKAWKAASRKYHPDVNPNPSANRLMQMVNNAYDEAKVIVSDRQPHKNWKYKTIQTKLHKNGEDLYFPVEFQHSVALGIGEVPAECKSIRDNMGKYLLMDIHTNKILQFFTNQASAIKCLIELEQDYMNVWNADKDHSQWSEMSNVIKYYAHYKI